MPGELLARLVALIFASVCVGAPPADASPIPWNPETGWQYIGGYALGYGFYPVEDGAVWIGWHLSEKQWIIFGTTDPPGRYADEWHAECGGWVYRKTPLFDLRVPVFARF